MKLEIPQQRTKPDAHIEIRVQIEPVARENSFLGTRTPADAAIALKHRNTHTGARQISGKSEAVVACSDYNTVEVRHAAPLGAGALYPKTTHETLANLDRITVRRCHRRFVVDTHGNQARPLAFEC